MILIIILIYILIIFVDQVSLFKEGKKKDFYVSSIMCIISFTVAMLLVLKIHIPSPAKAIEGLVKIFFNKF